MRSRSTEMIVRLRHAATVLILCSTAGISYGQTTAQGILENVRSEVLKHRSINYEATIQTKFSNIPDTFLCKGAVLMGKVAADTLFGGRIRVNTGDTAWTIYDLKNIYTCDTRTDSCTRYDGSKNMTWPLTSNIWTLIRWRGFLRPAGLDGWTAGTTVKEMLADTSVGGTACWHLMLRMPDEPGATEQTLELCVAKDDLLPIVQIGHVMVDGELQYHCLEIQQHEFDRAQEKMFDVKELLPNAVVTDYKEPEEQPMLAVGELAPQLVGDIFGSGPEADTVQFAGHITMVDFWYVSCPPCRSSVPMIDSLRQVYEERGVQFVGVDCWDDPKDASGLMKTFRSKHGMNYPALMAEQAIEEQYAVSGHPALFIVGRDGLITYNDEGYGPGLEKQWGAELDRLLAK